MNERAYDSIRLRPSLLAGLLSEKAERIARERAPRFELALTPYV